MQGDLKSFCAAVQPEVEKALEAHRDPRVKELAVQAVFGPVIIQAASAAVMKYLAAEGAPVIHAILGVERSRHPSINWQWLQNFENVLVEASGGHVVTPPAPPPA